MHQNSSTVSDHEESAGVRQPGCPIQLDSGFRSGRLVVIGSATKRKYPSGASAWHYPVRCDCGTVKATKDLHLYRRTIQSCGCLVAERTRAATITHGQSKTRLYKIWAGMKTRATNPNIQCAAYYSGRGISLYTEWERFETFRDWALSSGYEDNLTIERQDVNGDYSPDNCCWVTRREQSRNTRQTLRVTAFGETKLVPEWLEDPRCKATVDAMYKRLEDGWHPESAIVTPTKITPPPKMYSAFNEEKSAAEWSKDPRCKATRIAVYQRLRNGWDPESAISTPVCQGPRTTG